MLQRLTTGHYVWALTSGERGSISPQLIVELARWKQNRPRSTEAGGLILGFIDKDTKGILAEEITKPGSGDKRTRTSFYRGPRHQVEAEQWNQSTLGHGTQLGLWHTHPEPVPVPSNPDLSDCRSVLQYGRLTTDGLLYVIVGTAQINFWYAKRNSPLNLLGAIDI